MTTVLELFSPDYHCFAMSVTVYCDIQALDAGVTLRKSVCVAGGGGGGGDGKDC